MGLGTLLFLVSFIWATIYSLDRYLSPHVHPLLPGSTGRRRAQFWGTSSTKYILKHFHLRVQTTAWNNQHDILTNRVTSRHPRIKLFLERFYDTGLVLGILGMLVAFGLLLWTAFSLMQSLLRGPGLVDAGTIPGHAKRELVQEGLLVPRNSGPLLKPIIPGVTVPLMHLPFTLASILCSQIIHEVGHALAAALESVPILGAGISFTVLIPSAFVTLSSASFEALSPRRRMRIIAAGPFHNAAFWCLLIGARWAGIGKIWSVVGYRDVTAFGIGVVGVAEDSPLKDHLPLGSIIMALDDLTLSSGSPKDLWTEYLTGLNLIPVQHTMGWCVDGAWFLEKSQTCCPPSSSDLSTNTSCFTSLDLPLSLRCLDPVPLLTQPRVQTRCRSLMDCADQTSLCARPHERERLLRITVQTIDGQQVVLWSGPRREVWEQVEVGHFLPRLNLFPLGLPSSVKVIFEYLQMATLSLYLFNLLPLPMLDGAQLFTVALDSILQGPSGSVDLDALEGGTTRRTGDRYEERWKRGMRRAAVLGTSCLVALCAILGLVNSIK